MSTAAPIMGFHTRPQDEFLSNFFHWPFILHLDPVTQQDSPVAHLTNHLAPTVEHFFQAAKTLDRPRRIRYPPALSRAEVL